jgi:hypothetical protein
VLLFILAVILITIGYFVSHDTNKDIFEKAKQEINDHKIGYAQLYQYLEDSTCDACPGSKIHYLSGKGLNYISFGFEDTLNQWHESERPIPLFIDDLKHHSTVSASFRRKMKSLTVSFPYVNYHFYETSIIFSKMQEELVKKYLIKGYQLCNTIDEVSDTKNSIIKIDSAWVLTFYKR